MIPLTVYLKVVPSRGLTTDSLEDGITVSTRGGRFDYLRDLQELSVQAYDELVELSDYQWSQPGGGQNTMAGRLGGADFGLAAKPQFGNVPALLSMEGFYTAGSAKPISQRVAVISCGSKFRGFSSDHKFTGDNYTTAYLNEVKAVAEDINTALAGVIDDTGGAVELYKMYYNGVLWGVGGHHWPV